MTVAKTVCISIMASNSSQLPIVHITGCSTALLSVLSLVVTSLLFDFHDSLIMISFYRNIIKQVFVNVGLVC